jgi:hypothetical protein
MSRSNGANRRQDVFVTPTRLAIRDDRHREALLRYGFVGAMGRRGNPYDNATPESFMKTTVKTGSLISARPDDF